MENTIKNRIKSAGYTNADVVRAINSASDFDGTTTDPEVCRALNGGLVSPKAKRIIEYIETTLLPRFEANPKNAA